MNDIKSKVKTSANVIAIVLQIVAVIIFVLSITVGVTFFQMLSDPIPFAANKPAHNFAVAFASYLLTCVLCLFLSFMFRRVAKEQTPFFKELPLMIKVSGLLLFLTLALPRWMAYALVSVAHGAVNFAVFDEVSTMGLLMASVIFCLGHLFEYGYRLQVDHDEIV